MVNGLGHKVFVSMLEQTWGYLEGGSLGHSECAFVMLIVTISLPSLRIILS